MNDFDLQEAFDYLDELLMLNDDFTLEDFLGCYDPD